MSSQATDTKVLEYFNVYMAFEYYGNSKRSSNENLLHKNFDENMQDFDFIVNEKLEEGWRPLGPPTFSLGWCDMARGGFAIQTLVREKNIEQAVVVDVNPEVLIAEEVKPLRSSTRIRTAIRQ
jgi:hypothetical protein